MPYMPCAGRGGKPPDAAAPRIAAPKGPRMPDTTALGFAAALLTTLAFVPQAVKTWRTRSTGDLSLGMYLILVSGMALWFLYGLAIGDLPLVMANGTTLVLAGSILYVKLRG